MTLSNNVNGNNNNINHIGPFGDTTLTKVFVGGLAWETPKEAMRDHFEKYGEILEAVIISDKLTGRSKGYGFVTFKEPESAKKACEEATPIINGRRANCNLASLGARRPRSSNANTAFNPPAPQQGSNIGPRSMSPTPANPVQWYYPAATPAATPFHRQQQHLHQHAAVPVYGYPPTYIAADISYNPKLSYTGGTFMGGHFPQVYPGVMSANTLMPMYPMYHYHQAHTMGPSAHMFPTTTGPISPVPAIISKPASITAPNSVCLAVE
ncbi:probable RNA-binding protein ARP1 isoform X2 [Humulus lupulus]|uniref:probable RNA-binding protein ARP1 isoform X2 n=1 Tax=Humulus lupulus TaxID=3486 RepID=UPI002B4059DB|nr:probable RNA-binding protein ARP1 isoform X2 [Humulus lupulus]